MFFLYQCDQLCIKLLLSIYINDLIRTSNKCKFIMYANDTTIYFNLEDFDPDNVSNEINNELEYCH